MAAVARFNRLSEGAAWKPREVWFAHSKPKDVSEHARIFRAPVRFGMPVTSLLLDSALLNLQCVAPIPLRIKCSLPQPTSFSRRIPRRPISRRASSASFASACAVAISVCTKLPVSSASAAAPCKENCARNLPRTGSWSNKLAATSRFAYCSARMPQLPKSPMRWVFPIPPPSITRSNAGTECPREPTAMPKFVSSNLSFRNADTQPRRALAAHRQFALHPPPR